MFIPYETTNDILCREVEKKKKNSEIHMESHHKTPKTVLSNTKKMKQNKNQSAGIITSNFKAYGNDIVVKRALYWH